MEATLKALADLLLQAVPTIVFFVFLAVFLKKVYFQPVARVLEERRKATEGVRELAERAMAEADKKKSEFERALDLARGDLQREHDEKRRQWTEEQSQAIAQARAAVDQQITEARQQIARDVEQAQRELDSQIEALSGEIVNSVLERRAA